MVTAFCHQLGWKNMEMLISQFQDRLQFGIHSELLDLMKLPSLNGVRARTLFNAGFETIASIASAEANVIENILHKSVPFQSEKEREGDDDVEVRKRNKMKNIWITGYCGLTAREAAENLILEARKYVVHEIGGAEIKWKDFNSSNQIVHTASPAHPSNKSKSQMIESCDSIHLKELSKTKKEQDHDVSESSKDIINSRDESVNRFTAEEDVINLMDEIQPVPLKLADERSHPYQNNHYDNEDNNGNMPLKNEILDNTNLCTLSKNDVKQKVDATTIKSPTKQDLIWDSLNFTNAVFDNISKLPFSDNFLSPNISFGSYSDNSDMIVKNQINVSTSVSSKDISLFSSDGDNSSLFEDSLPLDLLPNTIIDCKKSEIIKENIFKTTTIKEFNDNINTESIINCFKSSVLDIDDDENFTLVYEDEKSSPKENNSIMNISQDNEIGNTQEFKEMGVKTSFISPLKRHAVSNKHCLQSSAKKVKKSTTSDVYSGHVSLQIKISQKSESFVLKIAKNLLKCYIFREDDVCKNFFFVENTKEVSVVFDVNSNDVKVSSNLIGSNILGKKKRVSENIQNNIEEKLHLKGIAFYFNNLCLYLDISSLKSLLPALRLKLKRLFSNASLKLRMLSAKTNCLYVKKWLEKDLLTQCDDITIAEWLLDSDEKVSRIVDLVKYHLVKLLLINKYLLFLTSILSFFLYFLDKELLQYRFI